MQLLFSLSLWWHHVTQLGEDGELFFMWFENNLQLPVLVYWRISEHDDINVQSFMVTCSKNWITCECTFVSQVVRNEQKRADRRGFGEVWGDSAASGGSNWSYACELCPTANTCPPPWQVRDHQSFTFLPESSPALDLLQESSRAEVPVLDRCTLYKWCFVWVAAPPSCWSWLCWPCRESTIK